MTNELNKDECTINSVKTLNDNITSEKVEKPHKDNNIDLSFVRNRLEDFREDILKNMEHRMSSMIDEVLQELRQHHLQRSEFKNFAQTERANVTEFTWDNRSRNITKSPKTHGSTDDTNTSNTSISNTAATKLKEHRRTLPEKIFMTRESYLTALLEVEHMRTIYHIFFMILIVLLINCICYDYFVEGRINFGLETMKSGFNKIHYVFIVWFIEHLFVLSLYYAFNIWRSMRLKLINQKLLKSFWNYVCLVTYISSQLLFAYIASAICLRLDLPFISASVLLLESTRLLMKMHAFIRSNAARVLSGKIKGDDALIHATENMPSFSAYLYFLFAPTLIYRDHYPRTSRINWRFAMARFLEVVAVAFLYSYIHERYIIPNFSEYGRESLTASAIIVKLFGMLMPSMIVFLGAFYVILHSWLNFTAELLRFGDRMFYKDWWTANNFDAYYRNWNVVVHDWLYEYVYRDFYTHVFKGSKLGASLVVFIVSAWAHEHVLSYALQIFFPVMFFFFVGVGVPLVLVTRQSPKNVGNIILWFSLTFGNGMMLSLYSMEYYARQNCGKIYSNWTDYVTPALWSCYIS